MSLPSMKLAFWESPVATRPNFRPSAQKLSKYAMTAGCLKRLWTSSMKSQVVFPSAKF